MRFGGWGSGWSGCGVTRLVASIVCVVVEAGTRPKRERSVIMSFALTDSAPARIGAAAWFVVPVAWSISVVLDRTREWEGLPQLFWMVGAAALVVAGVIQLVMVLGSIRPVRDISTRAGVAVLGLGLVASIAAGWAIVLWVALYAVGMLLVGRASGSRQASLIGVSFAMGTGAFILLTVLEVGRPDSYGDYPVAGVTSLLMGTIGAGLGMLLWSQGSREESNAPIEATATPT